MEGLDIATEGWDSEILCLRKHYKTFAGFLARVKAGGYIISDTDLFKLIYWDKCYKCDHKKVFANGPLSGSRRR